MKKKVPLIFFSLLILILLCIWLYFKIGNFPVKSVAITSNLTYIKPESLEKVITDSIKNNFFSLNIEKIKKQLLEDVPWIYRVNIRRMWPSRLLIEILQQIPVAFWNGKSMINENFEIFTPKKLVKNKLPELFGPLGSQRKVMFYYKLMSQKLSLIHLDIVEMGLSEEGSWHLLMNNGINLYLGNIDIIKRLSVFIKLYDKLVRDRAEKIFSIDARYNDGLAIKFRNKND